MRGFAVSEGTFVVGEVDDPENAPTLDVNSREIGVGNYSSPKNAKATLILNNGTISLTSQFYMSFYSQAGTELTFQMNGGRIVKVRSSKSTAARRSSPATCAWGTRRSRLPARRRPASW